MGPTFLLLDALVVTSHLWLQISLIGRSSIVLFCNGSMTWIEYSKIFVHGGLVEFMMQDNFDGHLCTMNCTKGIFCQILPS